MTTKEFKRLQQFLTDAIEKGVSRCNGSVIQYNSEEIQRCYIDEASELFFWNRQGNAIKSHFNHENMLVGESICNIHYKYVQEINLRIVFNDNTIRYFERSKGRTW